VSWQSAHCFSRFDLVVMDTLRGLGRTTFGDVIGSFLDVLRRFMV